MDAIRYLDADTILDYLHNSSETYLEGLIPQSYGFPTETDRSVYVRLLKVPVRDKASEVYMQAIPYKTFEGDSNRPIEEFGKDTKFEKVGVVIDSSRLWLMEPLWRICTQSRQKFDDADFVSEFWDAFTRKVLKEYAVDAGVEKSEAVKNLAKQYAILDILLALNVMLNVIYTSAEGKCRKETGTSFAELPLMQRFDAITRYIEDEFETCLMMLSDIPYMQWT